VEAIQSQGLTHLEQLQTAVKAGTGCGACHPEIEEILAELHGEPVPKRERLENALVCRSETMRRIEGSLSSAVVPKLPEGTELDLVSVRGLQVALHLRPDDDPALRELIAEKLKKLVCADLEICFR
jgi:NifU-like protein